MSGLEIRELECFIVLAEELHFGRAGERLYVSQSRVSQLLRSLESRIGARLVDRTSRRVRLTPFGARFLCELRPAYDALRRTVDDARDAARGTEGVLRLGFQGAADGRFMKAVAAFEAARPGRVTEIAELALSDPFGAVRRGEVDAAIVLLPVREPDLVLGPVFPEQEQTLAVSVRHELAGRASLSAEDLIACPLISPAGPAPAYWRSAQAPETTPGGGAIPRGAAVTTLQEGIALVAAGRGAMLLCRPTAGYHTRRDVVFVPVRGLPGSALGLVWHRDAETARVRAFRDAVAAVTPEEPRPARPGS
ncbi:LysR family transcriptional regulator [Microtetraspora niveoalba]|uniref:LysR family transcriptional regulator n=1 Tax=Microtetraspora niveoalba TaxID=46175 RepID=UPI0008374CBC|nr:LysR family transcriptional regulator [Microtetraspora niveoalba]